MTLLHQNWDFSRELGPQFLNYVCLLGGYQPPSLTAGFRYCQIGCGTGATLTGIAAMYGEGEFTGIDSSAENIESAEALADDAELSNVNFLHRDIENLGSSDLPAFDYMVLTGVYTLADAAIHEALLQCAAARLAPGGILFAAYEALPGFAAIQSLLDLARRHTSTLDLAGAARAQAALDYLTLLRKKKAGLFTDNPSLSVYLDAMQADPIDHFAGAVSAPPVEALAFHQVATEMEGIGLAYVGSALLNLNFIDIAAPPEFHELLRKSATRTEFETHGDAIRNQAFRQDVFTRSAPELDEAARDAMLAEIPFGTRFDAETFPRQARFGGVELKYDAEIFEIVIQAAASGAKTVMQMKELDNFGGYGAEVLTDAIRFLSAGESLLPFARSTQPTDPTYLTANRYFLPVGYNLSILKQRLLKQPALGFVSPLAGAGFEVSMLDALITLCMAEAPAEQLADHIFHRLIEAGQQMIFEEGSEADAIASALEKFHTHRLGKFLEMGFLAPAPH